MAEKDFKVRKGLVVPDGSVGIGTAAPSTPLHIKHTTSTMTNFLTMEAIGSSSPGVGIKMWSNVGTANSLEIQHDAYGETNFKTINGTDTYTKQLYFHNNGKVSFESGNVGIGLHDASAPLEVKGSNGYLRFDSDGSAGYVKSDYSLSLDADPEASNSSGYRNIKFNTGNVLRASFTDDGIFHAGHSIVSQAQAQGVITGTIDPAASKTVTGVGTRFKQELKVGDGLVVSGETRHVAAIATDTSLTVNTAFSDNANDTSPERIPALFSALKSDSSLAMVITSEGDVGIGTMPKANLHISGGLGDGVLIIEADTDNSGEADQPYIVFEQDGGTQHSAIGSHSGGDTDNNALIFSNSVGSSGIEAGMIFKTGTTSGYGNAVERMRITPTGNVGIGTDNPDAKLHIQGGANDEVVALFTTAGGTSGSVEGIAHVGLSHFSSDTVPSVSISAEENGIGSHQADFRINTRGTNTTNAAPTEKMRVTHDGKVGIGITSPSILLDVNGVSGYGGALDTTDAGSATAVFVESKGIRLGKDSAGGQSAPIEFMASHWGLGYGWKIQNKDTTGGTDLLFYSRRSVTSWDEEFRITDDGKVGIGGVNPDSPLHVIVDDNDELEWIAELRNTPNPQDPTAFGAGIKLALSSGSGNELLKWVGMAAVKSPDLNYSRRVDAVFYTQTDASNGVAPTEKMRITGDGNVGIGNDASNGFKLEVTGTTKLNGNVTLGSDYIDNVSIIGFSGDGGSPNSILSDGQFGISENSDKFTIWEKGGIGGSGVTTAAFTFDHSGHFTAVSKSFLINHPTKPGMMLRHGSLEGPELAVYVRGSNRGDVIDLPDYWEGLVDEDTITVQLTAKGRSQNLYVKSVNSERVVVGGNKSLDYYYFIQGERKDIDKMVVEE